MIPTFQDMGRGQVKKSVRLDTDYKSELDGKNHLGLRMTGVNVILVLLRSSKCYIQNVDVKADFSVR